MLKVLIYGMSEKLLSPIRPQNLVRFMFLNLGVPRKY